MPGKVSRITTLYDGKYGVFALATAVTAAHEKEVRTLAVERDTLLALYRSMLMTRRFEEVHDRLLREGKCWLMGHFGTGQEAVGIGVTAPLRPDDWLFPTHRGVAEYIGKGMAPSDIWAEYYGKATGRSKGKGGLHLCDMRLGILFPPAALGADFSMAVGTGYSSKRRGSGQVTLCYFGEGTSQQADFHPALNMAALWQLPVLFACVNNQYTELSHYRETSSTADIAPRAAGYGIPYQMIEDGNDIEACYEAARQAVDYIRGGQGPYFLEFKTYRISSHFTGDPGGYQPAGEIAAWREKDPLKRAEARLLALGVSQAELAELDRAVVAEVEAGAAAAMAAPDPDPAALFTDVYCEG